MSLIEQAVRRLAELGRSGADVADVPSSTAAAQAQTPQPSPIPEALVRARDAREDHASGLSIPAVVDEALPPAHARQAAIAKSEGRGRAKGQQAAAAAAASQVRHVDLNLERLAARGFVTPGAPQSQIADEFRIVKRPLIQNALGKAGTPRVKDGNLVMVTSSLPGEGKTFTAVNLAISIAMEYDNTVLLVDADVVNPAFPALLGTSSNPGLLDLLTRQDLDVRDVIVKTNVPKLSVIPAGKPQRHATELLASEQMTHLLREVSSRYADRIIIFDSPPLLATTEARILASHMGQVVMVVAAHTTSHQALKQAMSTIEGCDVVLMMLNKAQKTDVSAYYGYGNYKLADAR